MVEGVPAWTPEDAAALILFLRTPSGAKVVKQWNARLFQLALAGAADESHTTYAGGCTRGFHDALRWFDSLSRVARVPATNTQDTEAPEGEEQLRERYSP